MSYQEERDRFIAEATKDGLDVWTARRLLSNATTLHRLAEAQCNGDWPADNGERKTEACSRCGGHWVPSSLLKGKLCPDCRAEDRVKAMLPPGWSPVFGGDPRGCVLVLSSPAHPWTDDGRGRGIAVPVR